MKIWWNETPNPFTGFRKSVSPTGDLLRRGLRLGCAGPHTVVVGRVHRRDGEAAGGRVGPPPLARRTGHDLLLVLAAPERLPEHRGHQDHRRDDRGDDHDLLHVVALVAERAD